MCGVMRARGQGASCRIGIGQGQAAVGGGMDDTMAWRCGGESAANGIDGGWRKRMSRWAVAGGMGERKLGLWERES